uniref:Uncharacterized protein n=1 Tax=Oryzias sinensis TaxID=183150 RepID=A0A8C7YE36_9TELE
PKTPLCSRLCGGDGSERGSAHCSDKVRVNLLVWIQRNLLKERPELFVQGDSVCLLLPFTIKPIILLSLLRSCDF